MSWPFLAAQGCDHTVLPQDCLSAKINLIPYNTVEGLGMVTPLARAAGKFQSDDTDEQACELAKIARRDAGDQDVVEHHASFFPRLSNRKLRVTP